jgi:hypothetical protein
MKGTTDALIERLERKIRRLEARNRELETEMGLAHSRGKMEGVRLQRRVRHG